MNILDKSLTNRKRIGEIYRKELKDLKNIKLINYKKDRNPHIGFLLGLKDYFLRH